MHLQKPQPRVPSPQNAPDVAFSFMVQEPRAIMEWHSDRSLFSRRFKYRSSSCSAHKGGSEGGDAQERRRRRGGCQAMATGLEARRGREGCLAVGTGLKERICKQQWQWREGGGRFARHDY